MNININATNITSYMYSACIAGKTEYHRMTLVVIKPPLGIVKEFRIGSRTEEYLKECVADASISVIGLEGRAVHGFQRSPAETPP